MQNGYDKIKARFEEDPLTVLLIASLVATAAAKLISASSQATSRRTWAREVNRREMHDRIRR